LEPATSREHFEAAISKRSEQPADVENHTQGCGRIKLRLLRFLLWAAGRVLHVDDEKRRAAGRNRAIAGEAGLGVCHRLSPFAISDATKMNLTSK